MKSFSVIASASLLACLATAAPFEKRDLVWETLTQVDVITVAVTKTVWAGQQETSEATSSVQSVPVVGEKKMVNHERPQGPPASSSAPYVASSAVAPPPAAVVPTTTAVAPTTTAVAVASTPSTSSVPAYTPPVVPTTSAVAVQPTTTAVAPVAPATSAAAVPSAAQTSAYAATDGSDSVTSGSKHSGDGTYYDTGTGSCGIYSSSSDYIVAISHVTFDAHNVAGPQGVNPNLNPLCRRTITIDTSTGGTVQAEVVDRCVSCVPGSLDMSRSLALAVNPAAMTIGHFPLSWVWN